jgi:hypothetical protein
MLTNTTSILIHELTVDQLEGFKTYGLASLKKDTSKAPLPAHPVGQRFVGASSCPQAICRQNGLGRPTR